jgi:hypothetical protein
MNRRPHSHHEQAEFEVLAGFGGAQLVRHLSGRVELRGGSEEDRRAAREWVANFMPDVLAALQGPPDRRKR